MPGTIWKTINFASTVALVTHEPEFPEAGLPFIVPISDENNVVEVQIPRQTRGGPFTDVDIKLWKDNMWGLLGLKQCLEKKGAHAEASRVGALFKERSARADEVPGATCFCAQAAIAPAKKSSCW